MSAQIVSPRGADAEGEYARVPNLRIPTMGSAERLIVQEDVGATARTFGQETGERLNALFDTEYGEDVKKVDLSHFDLVNEKKNSDLTFVCHRENIYAHMFMVAIRCDDLLSNKKVVKKRTKHGHQVTVTLRDQYFTKASLLTLLGYVYSGDVHFPTEVNDDDFLKMFIFGRYLKLDRFVYKLEQRFKQTFSMENICSRLSSSHTKKCEDMEYLCLEWAVANYEIFTQSPDIKKMDIDLFQQVVASHATSKGGGSNIYSSTPKIESELSPRLKKTFVDDCKLLYASMNHSDLTVIVEGQKIPCHSAIIGHSSSKLSEVVDNENHHHTTTLDGISARAFRSFLRWAYYGETRFKPLPAVELIPFTKKYGLSGLRRVCEAKISRSVNPETCVEILTLTYAEMHDRPALAEEFRNSCLEVLLNHFTMMDLMPIISHKLYAKDMTIDILQAMQRRQMDGDEDRQSIVRFGDEPTRANNTNGDGDSDFRPASARGRKSPPASVSPRLHSTTSEPTMEDVAAEWKRSSTPTKQRV